MEPDLSASIAPIARLRHPLWGALFAGLAVFAILWLVNGPFREVYQPGHDDVTALADGLLLRPDAQWSNWFTRGHWDFFDPYPEWPSHQTAFARPAFQFLIYLAHFVLGRDWAAYLALNYLAVAGVAAVAFAIARAALGLGAGLSALAAGLVLLSSAVLEFSIDVVGAGSEPLASALVGCAFLAVVWRRDRLCMGLLLAALLTKETAVWAPFAAGLTVLLREGVANEGRHRALAAAAMLLPVALWLGLRFIFFGGIGGTYATADYAPLGEFLRLTAWKFAHVHHLFVTQDIAAAERGWAAFDRPVRFLTAALVFLLLAPWVLGGLGAATQWFGFATRERRWSTADTPLLLTLWAALSLVFYFTLALASARYAASAAMFVWPAVVGDIARRRRVIFGVGLAACAALSLARASEFVAGLNPPSAQSYEGQYVRAAAGMNAALRQVPVGIKYVYVLSAGGLAAANSDYLRALLGLHADIIRITDISWNCGGETERLTYDRIAAEGEVEIRVTLPDCARFFFAFSGIDGAALVDGRILRNESVTYDVPEAEAIAREGLPPALEIGHRMIVHIRPRGPARFIIERGPPERGIAWFDFP